MNRSTPKLPYSLSLLCWALNEEESAHDFLTKSLADLERVSDDIEIIVVDDGSTDRTVEIIQEMSARENRIVLIRHPRNLNVGVCTKTAVARATKEILFWNTFDNAYDTTDLARILIHLKDYDIVQRVRLNGGSDDRFKGFISRINYLLLRFLSGVPLTDFQNQTFHRTADVQGLNIETTTPVANPELLIKRFHQGATIKETPMTFTIRKKGKATGTTWRFIFKAFVQVLWYVPQWRIKAALSGWVKGKVIKAAVP